MKHAKKSWVATKALTGTQAEAKFVLRILNVELGCNSYFLISPWRPWFGKGLADWSSEVFSE